MTPAAAALLGLLWLPLAGAPAPEGEVSLTFDPAQRAVRGKAAAPVLVLEFSDFKCHACGKFANTVMPVLDQEFIQKGDVALAFVDFPLVEEPEYTLVAESVHCAGRQDRYWPMHDLLWENLGALGVDHLVGYAGRLGLDAAGFRQCLDSHATRDRVLHDLNYAYGLGLSSRPSFFIGRRDRSRQNGWIGRFVVGAQSHVVFRSLIQRMKQAAPSR
jgi:protein-disulfide isomerase